MDRIHIFGAYKTQHSTAPHIQLSIQMNSFFLLFLLRTNTNTHNNIWQWLLKHLYTKALCSGQFTLRHKIYMYTQVVSASKHTWEHVANFILFLSCISFFLSRWRFGIVLLFGLLLPSHNVSYSLFRSILRVLLLLLNFFHSFSRYLILSKILLFMAHIHKHLLHHTDTFALICLGMQRTLERRKKEKNCSNTNVFECTIFPSFIAACYKQKRALCCSGAKKIIFMFFFFFERARSYIYTIDPFRELTK